jgi:tRNA dimethylallyltransferase
MRKMRCKAAHSMSRALAIVGPTASGKSTVAMALAAELGGEIVSCDSVQVYQDFAIGCAKPSFDERRRVPHHLLDVVRWSEPFDAQRYRDLAGAAISDIHRRGRLAIVCGGTGLYLRALRWGLVELPALDRNLRAALYEEERLAPGSLYERLRRLDEATARRTEPHNLVHVIRALEIHALTGEPASVVRGRHGFADEVVPMDVIALSWPMALLRQRITERAQQMLEQGLVGEVEALLGAGVAPDCRPMRAVGYREAAEVARGEAALSGLAERISAATIAYARRQRTWLKREREVRLIEVSDQAVALAEVAALSRELSRGRGTS